MPRKINAAMQQLHGLSLQIIRFAKYACFIGVSPANLMVVSGDLFPHLRKGKHKGYAE